MPLIFQQNLESQKLMSSIKIIAFTNKGLETARRLKSFLDAVIYVKSKQLEGADFIIADSINSLVEEAFLNKEAIIFISALGIAVRYIAPFVTDKFTDSPVLVMDDNGSFVIPVLSGHVGSASNIAEAISKNTDAIFVATSSTDVNGAFSVDTFARENNLKIVNRDKIKAVSSKAIEGKPISLVIKNYPDDIDNADVIITDDLIDNPYGIVLAPKKYLVGIGLKKDKDLLSLENALFKVLGDNNIDIADVYAVASIDLKANEPGLKALSLKYRLPLIFYTKEMLNAVSGDFSDSDFVKETVGTGNVCERAVALLAGDSNKIIIKKQALNGVTIAVAVR